MNVYGPRQDYKGTYIAVIMRIIDQLEQGLSPVVYGDGSQSYDFIAVEDAAYANILGLKANTVDEFYNVGMGTKTSIKELAERLMKLYGLNIEIEYHPQGQTFVTNRIGSTEKAFRELGFKASIGLDDGLKRLIEWRRIHKQRFGVKWKMFE